MTPWKHVFVLKDFEGQNNTPANKTDVINKIKNGKNISLEFQEKSYEFEIMLNITEYIIETKMNFLLFIYKKLLKKNRFVCI